MAHFDITAADVRLVKAIDEVAGVAGAASMSAGYFVRYHTDGTFIAANGTDAAHARCVGMALHTTTLANQAVTVIRKGYVDIGDALSGAGYGDPVYLDDTDYKLTLTSGESAVTKIVGYVQPNWANGSATAPDKLLYIDL